MHRVDQQQHKAADDRADDRAKGGDEVGHCDHHGDEPNVLHPENHHKRRVRNADDGGIQQAVDDVADQNLVTTTEKRNDAVKPLPRHQRAQQAGYARSQRVLGREQIHGKDERDHPVHEVFPHHGGSAQDVFKVIREVIHHL